jgi:hypothetical protein
MWRAFTKGITPLELLRSLRQMKSAELRWSRPSEFLVQLTAIPEPLPLEAIRGLDGRHPVFSAGRIAHRKELITLPGT